jgi:hypothetical protein
MAAKSAGVESELRGVTFVSPKRDEMSQWSVFRVLIETAPSIVAFEGMRLTTETAAMLGWRWQS